MGRRTGEVRSNRCPNDTTSTAAAAMSEWILELPFCCFYSLVLSNKLCTMEKFSSFLKPHRYVSLTQDSQASDSMEKLLEPQELEARIRHGRSGVLLTWCRAAYLLIAWVLTASLASLWLNALVNPSDLRGIELKDLEFSKSSHEGIEASQ